MRQCSIWGAGIGRGIARLFAGAGAAVIVSDLKPETAEPVATDITTGAGKTIGRACNLTTMAERKSAIGSSSAFR